MPDFLPPRRAQSIPVCAHFHFHLGLSQRACTSILESKRHSIQSSFPHQRHSISHLGARTGFLEGPCQLQTRLFCNDTHVFVPSRYFSTNWDIAEAECDWKDAILEQKALVNKLCVPRSA